MATEFEVSTGTLATPTTGDRVFLSRSVLGIATPYAWLYETIFSPLGANAGTSLLAARADHTHAAYVAKVVGGTAGHLAVLSSDGSIVDGGASLTQYVLPAASLSVLGGVKQGSGVSIAGDGTISVSGSTGAGTVNTGAANQLAFYGANGTTVSGLGLNSTFTITSGQLALFAVPLNVIATTGATSGQVLTFNGTSWVPAAAVSTVSGVTIDGSTIVASTSSPYQMLTADRVVLVNKTTGAATKILLPTNPVLWVQYAIKDGKMDAATNNIIVVGTIDGAPSFVMNANADGLTLFASSATAWWIV